MGKHFVLIHGAWHGGWCWEGVIAEIRKAGHSAEAPTMPVIEDFVRNKLMAGEPKEKLDALLKRLTPQPLALFTTPVSTGEFMKLKIPRSVVFCKNDATLSPGAYLGMAQGLGSFKLVEVDGSHEALFTRPAVVAGGLLEAVR